MSRIGQPSDPSQPGEAGTSRRPRGKQSSSASRGRHRRVRVGLQRRAHLLVAVSLVSVACAVPWGTHERAQAADGPNLVANSSFEAGTTGWRTNGGASTPLSVVNGGVDSASAGQITTTASRNMTLNDSANTVTGAVAGSKYQLSAWVRSSSPVQAEVRVREVSGSQVTVHGQRARLAAGTWTHLTSEFTVGVGGAELDLNVIAWKAPAGSRFLIDLVSLRRLGSTAESAESASRKLSNGCTVSARGIPECGAYFGGATGTNGSPASLEQEAGQPFGVRRTYWSGGQVSSAVRTASADLAANRLPWISFKLPYSWAQMASGRGDAWARDLAAQLGRLNGPVWVAFHHEPELDGNVRNWTAMQARLAPIIRSTAPNVAFTIIVTGWHQTRGDTGTYGLDKIWPKNTKVDLIAFDTYNYHGTPQSDRKSPADLRADYFEFLSRWAKARGLAWGIGELGYTDATATADPEWLTRTYKDLVELNGVAMAYFNSSANASGDWLVDTRMRRQQFVKVLRTSPYLR